MDCFELLKQDHDEVTQLLKQCKEAGADNKKGKEAFKKLARSLAVHAKVEEILFYPKFQDEEELSSLIEEAYEEHHAVEEMLQEMAQMSPGDEEWESKLKELKQNIEHHVKEEEGELFPKASKLLSKEEVADLGEAIEDEKQEMLKGSHREAKEVFSRLGL
jgi:hemerythrin-like domain-containing protein